MAFIYKITNDVNGIIILIIMGIMQLMVEMVRFM